MFSKVVVHKLTFPPTVYESSFFPVSLFLAHFLLMMFLMLAILTRVRRTLSVVLICFYFMARMVSIFFFMCFLAIWTSSFEKVLPTSLLVH
jgi:hypothetical protein